MSRRAVRAAHRVKCPYVQQMPLQRQARVASRAGCEPALMQRTARARDGGRPIRDSHRNPTACTEPTMLSQLSAQGR
eukprot:1186274-Prorocentrum_minimum.AAC.3